MAKEKSGIGLVVPTHNDEQTIGKCLTSVASQTLLPDQVIVADDCSTDRTIEVVHELQRSGLNLPIQVLRRPRNVGLGKNVADALNVLETPYFTKLDADDVYLNSRKLENERNLLAKRNNRVVAFSVAATIDEEGGILSIPENTDTRILGEDILFRRVNHMPREFLVSLDAVKNVGGYPTTPRLYVDWWLKVSLAAELPFESTGEIGSGYRVYPRTQKTRMSSRNRLIHAYWISRGFINNRNRYKKILSLDDLSFFSRVWGQAGLGMIKQILT